MDYEYLNCITPIDGRYSSKVRDLKEYFSEFSFNKYRIHVEIEYLIYLGKFNVCKDLANGEGDNHTENDSQLVGFLKNIHDQFGFSECVKLKQIEQQINHDVKAIEYYIKDIINDKYGDNTISNFVHFGLTSQDINSSANMLMIKDSITHTILPNLDIIVGDLEDKVKLWKTQPMLAKTHGQTATPTTVGKEFQVFKERLSRQMECLKSIRYSTKFGGANGNFNALHVAVPEIDWIEFGDKFIESLGLCRNQYTTQIDHYDNYSEIFDCLKRINIIFVDLCQDMWLYISRNIIIQRVNTNEVGSSTMPYKINPIDFENAEGNFQLSNSLLEFFSRKLPISRMQRDLTDSTILRNVGSALSYMVIGIKSLTTGLGKITINESQLNAELDDNYIVVTEAIQTRLKVLGMENSYEELKKISRNYQDPEQIKQNIESFIDGCDISETEKKYLKSITSRNYTGVFR